MWYKIFTNKYFYVVIVAVVIIVLSIIFSLQFKSFKTNYNTAMLNIKAYEALMDSMQELNKAFMMTIDELQYSNDLSLKELDSVRKELKIKDNKIKLMGKIKEYVYITDTLKVHDTIFKDEGFVLDTTLGDKWYNNYLHLKYPNEISSTIDLNTDLSVFLHVTRETIKPPCKTWLGRLFLRKHDVYNVTVIEHNPYANVKENKFVIIND